MGKITDKILKESFGERDYATDEERGYGPHQAPINRDASVQYHDTMQAVFEGLGIDDYTVDVDTQNGNTIISGTFQAMDLSTVQQALEAQFPFDDVNVDGDPDYSDFKYSISID